MNNQKFKERALAEAAQAFGVNIEISTEETRSDILREADSVMIYFDLQGRGFTKAECLHCHGVFAFSYTSESVKCCSVPCMAARLRSMGLKWDPDASLERRWGRYAPAIVPPDALKILDEKINLQAQSNGNSKPVETDDLFDLINSLGQP